MAERKHPFHWDVYSDLYDRIERVINSEDPRLDPLVRRGLEQARAEIWRAWDLQQSLERAGVDASETRRRISEAKALITGGQHG
jgi:hypothetical protein